MSQNNPSSPYDISSAGVQNLVEQLMTLYAEKYAEREENENMIISLTQQLESLYTERQEWDSELEKRNTAIRNLTEQLTSIYCKFDELS